MSTEVFLILLTQNRANVEAESGKVPAELSAEGHQNQIMYSLLRSLPQNTRK